MSKCRILHISHLNFGAFGKNHREWKNAINRVLCSEPPSKMRGLDISEKVFDFIVISGNLIAPHNTLKKFCYDSSHAFLELPHFLTGIANEALTDVPGESEQHRKTRIIVAPGPQDFAEGDAHYKAFLESYYQALVPSPQGNDFHVHFWSCSFVSAPFWFTDDGCDTTHFATSLTRFRRSIIEDEVSAFLCGTPNFLVSFSSPLLSPELQQDKAVNTLINTFERITERCPIHTHFIGNCVIRHIPSQPFAFKHSTISTGSSTSKTEDHIHKIQLNVIEWDQAAPTFEAAPSWERRSRVNVISFLEREPSAGTLEYETPPVEWSFETPWPRVVCDDAFSDAATRFWEEVHERFQKGCTLWVHGPPGTGKSALLSEFLSRAKSADAWLIQVACDSIVLGEVGTELGRVPDEIAGWRRLLHLSGVDCTQDNRPRNGTVPPTIYLVIDGLRDGALLEKSALEKAKELAKQVTRLSLCAEQAGGPTIYVLVVLGGVGTIDERSPLRGSNCWRLTAADRIFKSADPVIPRPVPNSLASRVPISSKTASALVGDHLRLGLTLSTMLEQCYAERPELLVAANREIALRRAVMNAISERRTFFRRWPHMANADVKDTVEHLYLRYNPDKPWDISRLLIKGRHLNDDALKILKEDGYVVGDKKNGIRPTAAMLVPLLASGELKLNVKVFLSYSLAGTGCREYADHLTSELRNAGFCVFNFYPDTGGQNVPLECHQRAELRSAKVLVVIHSGTGPLRYGPTDGPGVAAEINHWFSELKRTAEVGEYLSVAINLGDSGFMAGEQRYSELFSRKFGKEHSAGTVLKALQKWVGDRGGIQ